MESFGLSKRTSAHCHYKNWVQKDEESFLEVTEWSNGEGFDITFSGENSTTIHVEISHQQWHIIQSLVKSIEVE